MAALEGEVTETLWDDGEFILSRIRSGRERHSLLQITASREPATPESHRRLAAAFAFHQRVDSSFAARPLRFGREQGRDRLLLEDPGGTPLARALGQPLELGLWLRMALALATTLRRMHQHGVLHLNLTPAHVLFDAESGRASLLGFGRERPAPPASSSAAANARRMTPYSAPEQIGQSRRALDARTDLYAAGACLLEMLTGSPHTRFEVHAETPDSYTPWRQLAPDGQLDPVPAPLARITARLLAHHPEERYQTAAGLEADLRHCLEQWEVGRRIEPFPLGLDDPPARPQLPLRPYGRDAALATIVDALDRVGTDGRPRWLLVTGPAGIGKSSLIREIEQSLPHDRGTVAVGGFEPRARDVPYAPLAQALRSLLRRLAHRTEEELHQTGQRLRETLGDERNRLLSLVPELDVLLGPQSPAVLPSSPDAQRRFATLVRRFLDAFAQPRRPLLLFLDDVQWADATTVSLIQRWSTDPETRHVLVVAAIRDTELTPDHPWTRLRQALFEASVEASEIALPPWSLDDVQLLVADGLGMDRPSARPLAQALCARTAGNPLAVRQLLGALSDEEIVRFDTAHKRWTWDEARLRDRTYVSDVVALLRARIGHLPEAGGRMLSAIACLGVRASATALSAGLGLERQQLDALLAEATRRELVAPDEADIRFVHERVSEAAYSLLPEAERAATHLALANHLAATTPAEKQDEHIFAIAHQFLQGDGTDADPEACRRGAELCLRAGRRALTATAHEPALRYFTAAAEFAAAAGPIDRRELILRIEFHRAECEFVLGRPAAAESRLARLREMADTVAARAALAGLRITALSALDQYPRALEVGLACLAEMGVELRPDATETEVRHAYDALWQAIGTRSIESLITLPIMDDPEQRAAMDILARLIEPALHTQDNLLAILLATMVLRSLAHGHHDASPLAYTHLAMVLGPRFDDFPSAFRFGQLGVDLVEKHGFDRYRPRVLLAHAQHVVTWQGRLETSRDLIRRAFAEAQRVGDLAAAASCGTLLASNLLASGEPLSGVQREAEAARAFALEAGCGAVVAAADIQLGLAGCLRDGDGDEVHRDHSRFTARSNGGHDLVHWSYWVRELQRCYLDGDVPGAIAASLDAEAFPWNQGTFLEASEFHFYSALALAATHDHNGRDAATIHQRIADHARRLQAWAAHGADGFADRAALVAAELARIEGRNDDAATHYEAALRLAHAAGRSHHEAIAAAAAARFFATRGLATVAEAYQGVAQHGYARWGANRPAARLAAADPRFVDGPTGQHPAAVATLAGPLDRAAVLDVAATLAEELRFDRFASKLLRLAVEHGSALRGLLLLRHGSSWRIEAEATRDASEVKVDVGGAPISPERLPQAVLAYLDRTRDRVILEDASRDLPFGGDPYVRQRRSRSVVCLPLVHHGTLVGALYLENDRAPRVFDAERTARLEGIVAQAVIPLANARLYAELERENQERRRAAAELARSEAYLAQGQQLTRTATWAQDLTTGEVYWSREMYCILGLDPEQGPLPLAQLLAFVHPEDRAGVEDAFALASSNGLSFDQRFRIVRPNGEVLFIRGVATPVSDRGVVRRYFGTIMDVTEHEQMTRAIRYREDELRQLIDFLPQHIIVLGPDGKRRHANRVALDYRGISLAEFLRSDDDAILHPDDRASVQRQVVRIERAEAFEMEARLRGAGGDHRWFLLRYNPLSGEDGRVARWYVTGVDIHDRKHEEERVRRENLLLREEIDKASMFDEIVGRSPALRAVLARVAKVAPTPSTVLITGETGTGKELIARAIHKRSARADNTFVSVNCAGIPQSLIASELFGHEKGAFTGALQRRVGRFELADGGTLFLDEVGELPPEAQVTLLRVLQEHEFERVGGNVLIRANVRLIAATNRDLVAAIANGTFRSDLYYRLNVFPIQSPPLRERPDDIPLLVEHFIGRYARHMGKRITRIDDKTLALLQSYPWPGNIRELQNVIERSVILCEGETFSIDENWLSNHPATQPETRRPFHERLIDDQRSLIEAALAASHGKVSGPHGAAAKLGMPPTTLDSKIKALNIDKRRFQRR